MSNDNFETVIAGAKSRIEASGFVMRRIIMEWIAASRDNTSLPIDEPLEWVVAEEDS